MARVGGSLGGMEKKISDLLAGMTPPGFQAGGMASMGSHGLAIDTRRTNTGEDPPAFLFWTNMKKTQPTWMEPPRSSRATPSHGAFEP